MSDSANETVDKNGDSAYMLPSAQPAPEMTIKAGIIHEIREFASNTTAHAIPRVVEAERRPIRIFWAIIFVTASVAFIIHLSYLTNYYLTYPIATSTSYKAVGFVFPDVTICNLLPFSLRKLELKDPGLKRFSSLNKSYTHFKDQLEELLENTENDLYSTVLNCTYNMVPCGPENFTTVKDAVFGQCFTFSTDVPIMANAPEYGLNLLIFAENTHNHTVPDLGFAVHDNWEASGIQLVIHEKNTHAHPDLKGVNVPPGVSARFAVNMAMYRLHYIFRDGSWRCDDDDKQVSFCVPESDEISGPFTETTEDCYTDAIQQLFYDNCECLSREYEIPSYYCEDEPLGNDSYCDTDTNSCYKNVATMIKSDFANLIVKNCVATCEQLSYSKQMSASAWPSHLAEKQVLKNIQDIYSSLQNDGIDTTLDEVALSTKEEVEEFGLLSNNLLRLCVYAESLTGDLIEEERAYPLPNFISEVGGILGLWLGGSMLTFLEPLELLANIIMISHMIKRQRRKKNGGGDVEAAIPMQAGTNDPFCNSNNNRMKTDIYCAPRASKAVDPFCK